MCGIAGKHPFDSEPSPHLGDAMAATMQHRGPNANSSYCDRDVVLSHCRLSILDTTAAGTQPMSNSEEMIHIVFNG